MVSGCAAVGCGSTTGADALDATARDVPGDVAADVAAIDGADVAVSECPTAAPMSGTRCMPVGLSCSWTGLGTLTMCTCEPPDGSADPFWSCFTAVPGPMPPPELVA